MTPINPTTRRYDEPSSKQSLDQKLHACVLPADSSDAYAHQRPTAIITSPAADVGRAPPEPPAADTDHAATIATNFGTCVLPGRTYPTPLLDYPTCLLVLLHL
jgi:hypothetical protein